MNHTSMTIDLLSKLKRNIDSDFCDLYLLNAILGPPIVFDLMMESIYWEYRIHCVQNDLSWNFPETSPKSFL